MYLTTSNVNSKLSPQTHPLKKALVKNVSEHKQIFSGHVKDRGQLA